MGDDGCAFEPAVRIPGHLGVRSMRERAEDVGAEFGIVSEVRTGTVIIMDWKRDSG